ncbi:MAG: hypothetical protein ACE5GX_02835 [Thermoanaerobaculia bacterium]
MTYHDALARRQPHGPLRPMPRAEVLSLEPLRNKDLFERRNRLNTIRESFVNSSKTDEIDAVALPLFDRWHRTLIRKDGPQRVAEEFAALLTDMARTPSPRYRQGLVLRAFNHLLGKSGGFGDAAAKQRTRRLLMSTFDALGSGDVKAGIRRFGRLHALNSLGRESSAIDKTVHWLTHNDAQHYFYFNSFDLTEAAFDLVKLTDDTLSWSRQDRPSKRLDEEELAARQLIRESFDQARYEASGWLAFSKGTASKGTAGDADGLLRHLGQVNIFPETPYDDVSCAAYGMVSLRFAQGPRAIADVARRIGDTLSAIAARLEGVAHLDDETWGLRDVIARDWLQRRPELLERAFEEGLAWADHLYGKKEASTAKQAYRRALETLPTIDDAMLHAALRVYPSNLKTHPTVGLLRSMWSWSVDIKVKSPQDLVDFVICLGNVDLHPLESSMERLHEQAFFCRQVARDAKTGRLRRRQLHQLANLVYELMSVGDLNTDDPNDGLLGAYGGTSTDFVVARRVAERLTGMSRIESDFNELDLRDPKAVASFTKGIAEDQALIWISGDHWVFSLDDVTNHSMVLHIRAQRDRSKEIWFYDPSHEIDHYQHIYTVTEKGRVKKGQDHETGLARLKTFRGNHRYGPSPKFKNWSRGIRARGGRVLVDAVFV